MIENIWLNYLQTNSITQRRSMLKEEIVDISVVIPVYNEQDSIKELCCQISESLNHINKLYEVIFVDDGSTDNSWMVIEELSQKDNRIKGIKFRRNFGKAEALCAGFTSVKSAVVFTMDADLQDDPKEIPRFLEKINEGFDVVSGWKKKRHDPLEKRLPSKFFNAVTSKLSGLKLHDFNCGFKCYRREVLEEIEIYGERHRFIPVLAHQRGFKVAEIEVEHHARIHGKSKYGLERYLRGFIDLITLTFLGRYERRPAHLFGGVGIACVFLGGAIDIYILYIKIFYGEISPRYPLLFLGILFTVVGIQLVTFGLISELLIVRSKRGTRPNYSIEKKPPKNPTVKFI